MIIDYISFLNSLYSFIFYLDIVFDERFFIYGFSYIFREEFMNSLLIIGREMKRLRFFYCESIGGLKRERRRKKRLKGEKATVERGIPVFKEGASV